MPERWEVWLAKVKFEDDPTTVKQRPVLVISNTQCYILPLKMTSHPPRETFPGEYALLRWQEAGLQKESTVRALSIKSEGSTQSTSWQSRKY